MRPNEATTPVTQATRQTVCRRNRSAAQPASRPQAHCAMPWAPSARPTRAFEPPVST